MLLRNVVILGLTLLGILLLTLATPEIPDRLDKRVVVGVGCFLLAYVSATLTSPRR
jgi:hypothetical protein